MKKQAFFFLFCLSLAFNTWAQIQSPLKIADSMNWNWNKSQAMSEFPKLVSAEFISETSTEVNYKTFMTYDDQMYGVMATLKFDDGEGIAPGTLSNFSMMAITTNEAKAYAYLHKTYDEAIANTPGGHHFNTTADPSKGFYKNEVLIVMKEVISSKYDHLAYSYTMIMKDSIPIVSCMAMPVDLD